MSMLVDSLPSEFACSSVKQRSTTSLQLGLEGETLLLWDLTPPPRPPAEILPIRGVLGVMRHPI